jgi:NAD(P)-dependent dehydrogenase (short-subunit alcohol dehydrogenase family)
VGQSLSHDVAIVTGAGRGIGRAIALSLAAEGAAISVFARTKEEIAATAALISGLGDGEQARSGDLVGQQRGYTRPCRSRLGS